jgi:hypothetical protein
MQLAAPMSFIIKSAETEDEDYDVLQMFSPTHFPLLIKSDHHWK